MTDEQLKAALATSPSPDRITPEYLKSRIAETTFERLAGGTMTLCIIRLDNGFQVIGESACADPANYDREIGEKIAYDVAERKIWPLLGFVLKEAMRARDITQAGAGATWQDRLRSEHAEISARIDKLQAALTGGNIPEDQIPILRQQLRGMLEYHRALAIRVGRL